MIVAEEVIGSVEAFRDREVETVRLDEEERKRSRVRVTTDAGTEVGLALGDATVREGDVVYADEERAIAIAFADREALVVDLADADGGADALAAMATLGHAVGNRHRDLAVRDGEVLVPVQGAGDRIVEEIAPHLPPGAGTRREAVDPTLFDAGGPGIGHEHEHEHDHGGDA